MKLVHKETLFCFRMCESRFKKKNIYQKYIYFYSSLLWNIFQFSPSTWLTWHCRISTTSNLRGLFQNLSTPISRVCKRKSFISSIIKGVRCFSWFWRALWQLHLSLNLKGFFSWFSLTFPWWERVRKKWALQIFWFFVNINSHSGWRVCYSRHLESNFPVSIMPLHLSAD